MHNLRRMFVGIAACTFASGCASFDLRRAIPWGEGADGRIEPPARVVAFWSDAVMQRDNGQPMRGFAGRLMFYREGSDEPIKVDGSLDVYAYDEAGRDPRNVVPDRKFCFAADQMDLHYAKGALGHSYSFCLPWDDVGGEKKEVSLIVRFTPTKGSIVLGEQAKYVLPGPEPLEVSRESGRDSSVQQAAYDRNEGDSAFPQTGGTDDQHEDGTGRGMTTTTIPLPRQFGQRPPKAAVRQRPTWDGPASAESSAESSAEDNVTQRATRPGAPGERKRMREIGANLGPIEGRRLSSNRLRNVRDVETDDTASQSDGQRERFSK